MAKVAMVVIVKVVLVVNANANVVTGMKMKMVSLARVTLSRRSAHGEKCCASSTCGVWNLSDVEPSPTDGCLKPCEAGAKQKKRQEPALLRSHAKAAR